jgi:hypothetical protein
MAQLLRTTTTAQNFVDLEGPDTGPTLAYVRAKEVDARPTALGTRVGLFRLESDLLSLRLIHGLTRSGSTANLLRRKPIERTKMFTFSNVDPASFQPIYVTHFAPTCWDKRAGRLRRGSVG